ncbi:hypothetical protein PR048_026711 [Dryococelus australis]|uniref:Uncharacterized protein n=1 Tax=Dryococelus australis TaxID=614101 RepID=A0ABQ9GM47_9NEOP|nr:hypothetical protein PR048_026711 [Dryococelus australis]
MLACHQGSPDPVLGRTTPCSRIWESWRMMLLVRGFSRVDQHAQEATTYKIRVVGANEYNPDDIVAAGEETTSGSQHYKQTTVQDGSADGASADPLVTLAKRASRKLGFARPRNPKSQHILRLKAVHDKNDFWLVMRAKFRYVVENEKKTVATPGKSSNASSRRRPKWVVRLSRREGVGNRERRMRRRRGWRKDVKGRNVVFKILTAAWRGLQERGVDRAPGGEAGNHSRAQIAGVDNNDAQGLKTRSKTAVGDGTRQRLAISYKLTVERFLQTSHRSLPKTQGYTGDTVAELPRPGHSGISHEGIVPDDGVGPWVYAVISRFPALSFRRCSKLT